MKKRIALFMTGNYARVLNHVVQFLPQYEFIAFCPNHNALNSCQESSQFSSCTYLFNDFNSIFQSVDVPDIMKKFDSINLAQALFVDKSSYKKYSGVFQERVICTMSVIIQKWIDETKPDYVFFPIIESIDAMLTYLLARENGVMPICYAHARHMQCSFFSEKHTETLPGYHDDLPVSAEIVEKADSFLSSYRNNPVALKYIRDEQDSDNEYLMDEDQISGFMRLIKNVSAILGKERHNKRLSLWIKTQIILERILVPIQRFIYRLIEILYLRSLDEIGEEDFDYFPLHFAPESSINTPAPFFIDQKRIIDKILLEREGNRRLILKEHPAMFGKRSFRFFRDLKKTPFVAFVSVNMSSIELIKKATKVYSVTGTACLEAFLLGVPWKQFGENFLSDWYEKRLVAAQSVEPIDFIRDVYKVSADFELYAPVRNPEKNRRLFKRSNIKKLAEHLDWHILKNNEFSQIRTNVHGENE